MAHRSRRGWGSSAAITCASGSMRPEHEFAEIHWSLLEGMRRGGRLVSRIGGAISSPLAVLAPRASLNWISIAALDGALRPSLPKSSTVADALHLRGHARCLPSAYRRGSGPDALDRDSCPLPTRSEHKPINLTQPGVAGMGAPLHIPRRPCPTEVTSTAGMLVRFQGWLSSALPLRFSRREFPAAESG